MHRDTCVRMRTRGCMDMFWISDKVMGHTCMGHNYRGHNYIGRATLALDSTGGRQHVFRNALESKAVGVDIPEDVSSKQARAVDLPVGDADVGATPAFS